MHDDDLYIAPTARVQATFADCLRRAGVEPEWPEPRPIKSSLPPVAPFAHGLLPPVIADYVFDIADRQQAPPDFAAIAALCALASLAGNRVRVRPKQHDDWRIFLTLWGGIIGRPSAMKTPSLRAALAPLFRLEKDLLEQWEEENKAADIESKMADLDVARAKKAAAKAMNRGDMIEARRLLSEARRNDDEVSAAPRVLVNDSTIEKLGVILNENPRGVLLIRDELPGLLARLESEDYQTDRAFYLEAYNGDGSFTFDRIGRGTVRIEHCTLGIIGAIQPSKFLPIVRGAISGTSDDGLIQRFQLIVWPDDPLSWEWIDRRPDIRAREAYEVAFLDLHTITWRRDDPIDLSFDNVSAPVFKKWMIENQAEVRSGKLSSALESHLLKFPKTACSLAAVFELVTGGREKIGGESLGRALDFMNYLKSHAVRIYSADSRAAESGAELIVERRAQLPSPFSLRNVHQKGWAGMADKEIVAAAIDLLIESGHIRAEAKSAAATGGRPTMTYVWNPRLDGG